MKIVLLLTYGVSLKTWFETGLLERELSYYQYLYKKFGIKTTVISYGNESDYLFLKKAKFKFIKIIPIYSILPYNKVRLFRFFQSFFIFFKIQKYINEFDTIKTNQIWGSWVLLYPKFFLKKKILIRGGYEPFKNSINNDKYLIRLIFWINSLIAYLLANRVIVTTQEIKNFIKTKFFFINKKITVIPNFIYINTFKILNLERLDKRILFVGRNSDEKNLDIILNALKNSQLTLDIIGKGFNKKLISKWKKKYNFRINYLGVIKNFNLSFIYNKYKVLILISKYEGNPKTILEAMASGCLILGSNIKAIKNLIKNNTSNMLVNLNQDDVDTINTKIKKILINFNKKNSFKNYIFIKNNFSISKCSKKEKNILLNI